MKRAEPGWLVLTLAGIAAAIGSFLPFYTFGATVDVTVWSRSLFPTATLIPVIVFLIGLEALFVLFVGHEPRSPFLSFTWSQARLAGSSFAILLAVSYAVQGRAGGDLGSGYLILSLSALATFAGAVMTRRAELTRGRQEIVTTEHPWRAAALRWRREVTAKVEAYAAGGERRMQPAPVSQDGDEQQQEQDAPAARKPDDATPEPSPVPRLSAVHSKPETEDKPKPAAPARKPAKRAPRKAASRKTVEAMPAEPKAADAKTPEAKPADTKPDEPKAEEPKAEEPKAEEPTAEAPTAEAPTAEELKTEELNVAEQVVADSTGDLPAAKDGDAEPEPESEASESDDERERPAAPG